MEVARRVAQLSDSKRKKKKMRLLWLFQKRGKKKVEWRNQTAGIDVALTPKDFQKLAVYRGQIAKRREDTRKKGSATSGYGPAMLEEKKRK